MVDRSAPAAMPPAGARADVIGTGLVMRVLDLVAALRARGVEVTASSSVDACRALGQVDLADRGQVRAALAATLLSDHPSATTFDVLFELFFPPRPDLGHGRHAPDGDDERSGASDASDCWGAPGSAPAGETSQGGDGSSDEDFIEEVLEALLAGDGARIARRAHEAVERFGRLPAAAALGGRTGTLPPAGAGGGWFRYRVLRALDPQALLATLLERDPQVQGATTALARRLAQDELVARIARLEAEVEAEVRRRAALDRDPAAVARASVSPTLAGLDLLHLSAAQQDEVRRLIEPLARRLAQRARIRRRADRSGRLDVRRTVRRSMSTGGVPFDPQSRPRRPRRPELFVICDVSDSVASFARFTLLLMHAMQGQFAGVRSFAFVDEIDEVTRFFADVPAEDGIGRLLSEAQVVSGDGHSDYGRCLEAFVARYGRDITARSTVLILGDARTNYRPSGLAAVDALQRRARRVWWLNPEPRGTWDTGDSVASGYARFVEEMVEVRNLRQLAAFVDRVA